VNKKLSASQFLQYDKTNEEKRRKTKRNEDEGKRIRVSLSREKNVSQHC
jgi:hypothetical protein